ncbi:MAG: hypothetical protein F4075_13920, partial [Acidobacteria bacterium]|nr:hypothetical protein [Acidobacteriota bacterium]
MRKGTKRLLTVGAVLTLGACGDTVEVVTPPFPDIPPITIPPPVIPPPPVVPPPPPVPNRQPVPQGTIPALNVGIEESATVAALGGYFSDPDGDELTFTGASSNPGVATVSVDGTTATVTGVARGSAVVTITAADPDSLQANQGFNVTVGQDGVRKATVAIFGLRDPNDRNRSVNPSEISGAVTVLLDVQYNDETVTGVALTLGDNVISCRGTSSDANQAIAGLAESGGAVEVDCYLNTAAVMGECMGEQLMPAYANGEYALGAQITTDGGTRESLGTQQVTLKNSGRMEVAHSGGNSVIKGGMQMYGGPTADDNMNAFHVCPVAYDGTMVGKVSLRALSTGAAKAEPHQAATSLAFKAPTTAPAASFNGAAVEMEGPFSWDVNSAWNAAVEDEGPGGREHWVFAAETIEDDGGLDVSSKFANMNPYGPYYFDFKAPVAPEELTVGSKASSAEAIDKVTYSSGSFFVDATDMGAGVAASSVSVGDCAMNSPYGPGEGGASVAAHRVDRSKVGFEAMYTDVMGIADLAEEDATRTAFTPAGADDNGADCYVAELASLTDKLGNAWMGGKTPSSWLQSLPFGVDKTKPVIEDVEFDGSKAFNAAADPVIEFEIQNPKLASGDNGTAVTATNASVTIPGATAAAEPPSVGTVAFDLSADDNATATVSGLPKDGEYTVTVTVRDGATPRNKATHMETLVLDTTDPTFSGSGPSGAMEGTATLGVNVSGVLKDATAGIKSYTLSIRDNSDPNSASLSPFFCEAADPVVAETRWEDVEVMGKGAKSIDIDRTLTLKRPAGGAAVTTAESFCVLLQATDATAGAGNSKDFSLGTFTATWTAQAVIALTGTLGDATEDTIPEAGTGTFSVALSQQPTGDVTVAITGGAAGLK